VDVGKEKPTLKDINNDIVPQWAPQWRKLGVELNLKDHIMDIIEHDHPNDIETCCSEMLREWLDNTPTASWEDLNAAVDKLQSDGMFVYVSYTDIVVIHVQCVCLCMTGYVLCVSALCGSSACICQSVCYTDNSPRTASFD